MRVYTYFRPDPDLPNAADILFLWEEAWAAVGVEPVIWNREPNIFPEYEALRAKIATFPNINPAKYEENNWMRWLAAREILKQRENSGKFLHYIDSDIFPGEGWHKGALEPDRPVVMWDKSRCPCAVTIWGQLAVTDIVEKILNTTAPPDVSHFADQDFFRSPQANYIAYDVVSNWPETDKPLVHISTNSLIGAGVIQNTNQKAEALKTILPII
jgi:hypothetical protein